MEIAWAQVPTAQFECVDAHDFSPPNGTPYDAVVSEFCFLNGHGRRALRKGIERMIDWIKPGGYLVFATMAGKYEYTKSEWNEGFQVAVTTFEKDEYLDIIKGAGVEVLGTEEMEYQAQGSPLTEPHLFIYGRKNEN